MSKGEKLNNVSHSSELQECFTYIQELCKSIAKHELQLAELIEIKARLQVLESRDLEGAKIKKESNLQVKVISEGTTFDESSIVLKNGLMKIIPTLRRIGPPPLADKDALFSLRDSFFGAVYVKYLKRFQIMRLLSAWLWRYGFPMYARYSPLRWVSGKAQVQFPLVKLSTHAARVPEGVYKLAELDSVETPPPLVFPIKDQQYLLAPHERYVFPDIFVTMVDHALVAGGSNLILAGDEVLCHDLYDFSRDYTSEELHGRTVINSKTGRVQWLTHDSAPESVSVAASFIDACAPNYAHWITEVLPRICLFCSDERFKDVPIVVNAGLHPNLMDSLLLVTGPERTIITVPIGRAIHVERLFCVSPTGYVPFERRNNKLIDHSHGLFSPYAFRVLGERLRKQLGQVDDSCSAKRIYLRRNSGVRKVINTDEVEGILVARGFLVVEPEKLTFAQQVSLFSNAEIVIGGSGAALANLVFCPPSARIIIFISKFRNTSYWYWQNIACATDKYVTYVFGEVDRNARKSIHSDFSVDIAEVLNAINY